MWPGYSRQIAWMEQGFLEVIQLVRPKEARQSAVGRGILRFLRQGPGIFRVVLATDDLFGAIRRARAAGVRFWPPIEEALPFADGLCPVVMSQVDHQMPWLVQYHKECPRPCGSGAFVEVTLFSPDPGQDGVRYRLAYGLAGSPDGQGGWAMTLDNARLRLKPGKPGLMHLTVRSGTGLFTLADDGQYPSG